MAMESALQIILRLSYIDLGTVNTSCCHALMVNYRYLRTGRGHFSVFSLGEVVRDRVIYIGCSCSTVIVPHSCRRSLPLFLTFSSPLCYACENLRCLLLRKI